MRARWAVVPVAMVALLAAGCGSSAEPPPVSNASDDTTDAPAGDAWQEIDPCTLVSEATLELYFGSAGDDVPDGVADMSFESPACEWESPAALLYVMLLEPDEMLRSPSYPGSIEVAGSPGRLNDGDLLCSLLVGAEPMWINVQVTPIMPSCEEFTTRVAEEALERLSPIA